MKDVIWILFLLLNSSSCTMYENSETVEETQYDNFKLMYSYASLGSGMGRMQPTFKITGTNYIYTYQQNSYYEAPSKQPDTICIGKFRTSSIDSIIELVQGINDTLVYSTTSGTMSGGIQTVWIINDSIDLTFRMHNASDPTVQKIVEILNSNLPKGKGNLWLFKEISAYEIQESYEWNIGVDTIME